MQCEMNVTVDRTELTKIVTKNRWNHRKIFLEALKGYRRALIKHLERMLKEARKGKRVNHMITLTIPQDMTAEYDSVLKMLEMSMDGKITLTAEDFHRFVEDRWDWSHSFLHSNAAYSRRAQVLAATVSD